MVQFAASGLGALILVAVVGIFILRHEAESKSIREARRLTQVVGRTAIEPNLTDALLRGDRQAIASLDRVVRRRVLEDPFVRVKIWTSDGRIVYSDEHRLIGARYGLDADDREALSTGRVAGDISDLTSPENRFEQQFGKLLEVYLPIWTPGGTPLLFEAYLRFSSVSATGRDLWVAFTPALVAALMLLWLLQLPLAISLVRRLRARQRDRETLFVRAIEASNLERRRIAADLHDGAVQDLAGISYSLAATANEAQRTPPDDLRRLLLHGAEVTRESMRQLRSLLVEIYPPNLHNTGLEAALADLLAPLRGRGIDAELAVDGVEGLDAEVERLFFRTAQEALRNVCDHADAANVRVELERTDGEVSLTVKDDGKGFDTDVLSDRPREGHFGLRLLADRAADLGGRLIVESTKGKGTTICVEVPAP